MAAATHDGTCQICGSVQRLPNGRLAKHGYTTRWGFFEGVCPGSGDLPYEQSIGLILDAAERAEKAAQDLVAQARGLREDRTGTKTWVRVYVPARWIGGGKRAASHYAWREVELREEVKTTDYGTFSRFLYETEKTDLHNRTSVVTDEVKDYRVKTMEDAVAVGRGQYADSLDDAAAKRLGYAKWQRERIVGWTEQELKPRGKR